MTLTEARAKYPEETKNLSDEKVLEYCQTAEILSDMCINSFIKSRQSFIKKGQGKDIDQNI